MTKLIHKIVRNRLIEEIPTLLAEDNKCCELHGVGCHMNFINYYAFSPFIDDDTGYKRIGAKMVAILADKQKEFKNGKFNAKEVIDHINGFLPDGMAKLYVDAQGHEYTYSNDFVLVDGKRVKTEDSRERRIILNFPDNIQSIIDDEVAGSYKDDEEVYVDTGLTRSAKRDREILKALREETNDVVDVMDCEVGKKIAQYMNNLPSNSFTGFMKNYDKAERYLDSLEDSKSKTIKKLSLRAVREQPIPLYRPVKNSVRLFTEGSSLQNLSRKVRSILLEGTHNLDLSSAQLAIIANLWNVPSVIKFLEDGGSLWIELIKFFGLSMADYKALKDIFKKYTYSICFGMGKNSIIEGNEKGAQKCKVLGLDKDLAPFGIVNGGSKFLEFPIFKDIIRARDACKKLIVQNKYAIDAFGKKVRVTGVNARSVMAGIAQSYEMKIIEPIFALAEKTNAFKPVLYLFDGVIVQINSNEDYWIDRISAEVAKVANEEGIYTKLVCTKNEVEVIEPAPALEEIKEVVEEVVEHLPVVRVQTSTSYWESISKIYNEIPFDTILKAVPFLGGV